MAKNKTNKTVREWGAHYNCSYQTIQNLKKEGYNLEKPEEVILRLSANCDNYQVPEWFKPTKAEKTTDVKGSTALGINAAIQRLKESELKTHNDYLAALKNNPINAPVYQKTWINTLDALRKIEESAPDINQANANTVNIDDLAKDLGAMFKNLAQDLNSLPVKIATIGQHTGKEELRKIVETEVIRILDNLQKAKYLNGEL